MGAIRKAKLSDLEDLLDIYNYEVLGGVATLDIAPKTYEERKVWFFEHNTENRPLLVYEEEGRAVAYASLSEYRQKEAYKSTAELSVYVHHDFSGRGIATALLCEILEYAKRNDDIHTLVSVITGENEASKKLHEKFGFRFCGTVKEAAYKFGRYIDIDHYSLRV